jgi:sirohydrochlorin ferrochelatase
VVTEKIRSSDETKFINRFNMGTKREFVGMPVDLIGEPQAWEAVVLPLNYARAGEAPKPQDNANARLLKSRALRLPRACFTIARRRSHAAAAVAALRGWWRG